MMPVFIVAAKEIRDHVTSKRFLVIFAILLLISIYSIGTGMSDYNKTLDSYKQNQQQEWYQQQIADLQKQIQDAQARGDSQDLIDSLQAQLDSMLNPSLPSVMTIFYSMNGFFVWICILLAIAMGFDLITREKEEGSLKSLLSHPVYRDSVINGKTLGAISVLVLAMAATLLITIAIILFFGVVPSIDELMRIAAYYVMALLVCLAFFAVAMAASTLAKNSSMAVLYALGIVIVFAGLASFSYQIVSFVAGTPPQPPDIVGPIYYGGMEGDVVVKGAAAGVSVSSNSSDVSPIDSSMRPGATPGTEPAILPQPTMQPEWEEYQQKSQQYWERYQMIQGVFDAISPITNFQNHIAQAILSDRSNDIRPLLAMDSKISSYYPYYQSEKTNVLDALFSVWMNILALIAEIAVAFAVGYVKFLRTDIR